MARIVTIHVYPPIAMRTFDWMAHYAGDEEGGSRGFGPTEDEAVQDLVENFPHDDGTYDRVVEERVYPETPL